MTAVEWLANEFYEKFEMKGDGALFNDLLNQAKEMEKQQIKDAHIEGFYSPPFRKSRNGEAELYYNETFKSE